MNNDINGTQEYFIRYSYTQGKSEELQTSWTTATRKEYFDNDYEYTTLDSLLYEVEKFMNYCEGKCNIDILSCNKV